ncbi:MAG: DUF1223 domain-containing protein [Gammaproteobacteria bacterium]|nr:DUF1223 domain-containing protein [Gammaproteobacteria bacterium]
MLSNHLALAVGVTTDNSIRTSSSPENRVVLLELYTSEGCSSCPPADQFLSSLGSDGITAEQLITVAFHVTYWDYIGWKDRFADKQFDKRQRLLAGKNELSTIYTPQFVMSGKDYRSFATFSEDVQKLAAEKSTVDISLSAGEYTNAKGTDAMHLLLTADTTMSDVEDIAFYLLVIEDNLTSDVDDGENEGRKLHHDYVVRQFLGPYYQTDSKGFFRREQTVTLQPRWKRRDISVVSFAQNQHTGEVLQAVILKYYQE